MNPLGSGHGTASNIEKWDKSAHTGRELYLTVNAYEFSNEKSPVITATLKLVQLRDDHPSTLHPNGSKFYSIELISYEMSDVYQMELAS